MAPRIDRTRLRAAAARVWEQPVSRALHAVGVGPGTVTLAGLALAGVTAWLVAVDALLWAGVVLLLSGALDSVDGALARLSGKASPAGALLDSAADRLGEGAVFTGAALLALARDDAALAVLAVLALLTSQLVSYVVARAQSLGVTRAVGVMTRPERIIVLALGLLTGYLTIALGVIAALSAVTALHRFLYAWLALRRGGEGPD